MLLQVGCVVAALNTHDQEHGTGDGAEDANEHGGCAGKERKGQHADGDEDCADGVVAGGRAGGAVFIGGAEWRAINRVSPEKSATLSAASSTPVSRSPDGEAVGVVIAVVVVRLHGEEPTGVGR